jgi:hypothetical protein
MTGIRLNRGLRPRSQSLADEPEFASGTIDNRGSDHASGASVYYDVYLVTEIRVDQVRVGIFFYHVSGQGGTEDGVTEGMDDFSGDVVGRYPEADRVLFAFQDPGYLFAGGQNEGVGSGEVAFQQTIQGGINAFGIAAEVAEVIANKRQLSLGRINMFDAANPFYSLMLEDIASQPIYCVRRVYDYPPIPEASGDGFQGTGLRIKGVDMQEHGYNLRNLTCG